MINRHPDNPELYMQKNMRPIGLSFSFIAALFIILWILKPDMKMPAHREATFHRWNYSFVNLGHLYSILGSEEVGGFY